MKVIARRVIGRKWVEKFAQYDPPPHYQDFWGVVEVLASEVSDLPLSTWRDIGANSSEEFEDIEAVIKTAHANRFAEPAATLLHWAAKLNKVWSLQQFLNDPACAIDAKCSKGLTALDWATNAGSKECSDILQKHPKQLALNVAKAEAEARAKAEAEAKPKIPDDYYCSITSLIMYDPVVAADGESYEREAIESWLANHNTSPNTNKELPHKNLTPNSNLKRAIRDFLEQYPQFNDSADYYLPFALKQEVVTAVEQQNVVDLERLLKSNKRFARESLRRTFAEAAPAAPKTNLKAKPHKAKQFEENQAQTSSTAVVKPIYLLGLVCEKGNLECLSTMIKLLGEELKPIALQQALIEISLMTLAKRKEIDAVKLLGEAFGYKADDYTSLLKQNIEDETARSILLECYLDTMPKRAEALHEMAVQYIKSGQLTELKQLVTHGLSLQGVDSDNNTLLHIAAEHNQEPIACWLLSQDRYLEKRTNKEKQRPRDVATEQGYAELAKQITEHYQRQKLSFFIQPLEQRVNELITQRNELTQRVDELSKRQPAA
ncbi:MAG: hypothetical protein JSS53_08490 [Proteobacteria bacterium]|nr:hypothetical protein [Pseudomonadota bacterium]